MMNKLLSLVMGLYHGTYKVTHK